MKDAYSQHQDLLKLAIMEGQKEFPKLRLFPAQVGHFYVKRFIDKTQYKFEGPYKIGTVGQADLNGVILLNGIGVRIEVEIKSGKTGVKKGTAQDRWKNFCLANGIIYIEATSPKQMVEELRKRVDEKVRQMSEMRK